MPIKYSQANKINRIIKCKTSLLLIGNKLSQNYNLAVHYPIIPYNNKKKKIYYDLSKSLIS